LNLWHREEKRKKRKDGGFQKKRGEKARVGKKKSSRKWGPVIKSMMKLRPACKLRRKGKGQTTTLMRRKEERGERTCIILSPGNERLSREGKKRGLRFSTPP